MQPINFVRPLETTRRNEFIYNSNDFPRLQSTEETKFSQLSNDIRKLSESIGYFVNSKNLETSVIKHYESPTGPLSFNNNTSFSTQYNYQNQNREAKNCLPQQHFTQQTQQQQTLPQQ